MEKQTAVEWFIEQLTKNPLPQSKDEFIDGDLVHIINKAKEMEKEHIIDANIAGQMFIGACPGHYKNDAEEYYNDIFKQD